MASSLSTYIYDDTYKGYIAHEMGHQLAEFRDAGYNPLGAGADAGTATDPANGEGLHGYELSDIDCPGGRGHQPTSAEFQSAAIWEGTANYYAATTWNSSTEVDCELLWAYALDWDNADWDGDAADDRSALPWSCAGSSEYDPGYPLPSVQHYESYCRTHGPELGNRSTELDWTRLWRDLDHALDLSTTEIFDIYDEADPRHWDWDQSGGDPDDYPVDRVEDAMRALGWGAAWDDPRHGAQTHGVWR
jgi:hypothetical protein